MADPFVEKCIELARNAIEFGRRAATGSLYFRAIAHYGAAGAALAIATELVDAGASPSEAQDRQLAALTISLQAGLDTIVRTSGNGSEDVAGNAAHLIAEFALEDEA